MGLLSTVATVARGPRRELPGLVVAITGGARGIGLATARALATEGCRVAIADLDGDLASIEAAALPGGPHHATALDVRDPASVDAFVRGTERALGPLDVLVNNAGVLITGDFAGQDHEAARAMVEVNVLGVVAGCHAALDRMLPRGRGQVVNVASAAARSPVGGEAVYSATKHAVLGLGRSLRLELRGSGVTVTTILPGLVQTELAQGTTTTRGLPWIAPDEVAAAIVDVVRRPCAERAVPQRLGAILWAQGLLPPVAAEPLARLFGADRVGLDTDARLRGAYHDRAQGPIEAGD